MSKFIICIDSDGCVMDTMEYKHRLCFGPIASEIWKIEKKEEFLKIWNDVNLYSKTRGINRFLGLVLSFELMNKIDANVKKLDKVSKWAKNTSKLSNDSLKEEISRNNDEELKLCLKWSEMVNEKIASLHGMDKPYKGVLEAFIEIKKYSEIAIVSSANSEAINTEWERHNLLSFADYNMGQEVGTKKDCIKSIIDKGYDRNNILMIGDSPGDIEAARYNRIKFYPIIFGNEYESWSEFRNLVLDKFINGEYIEDEYINKYMKKLNKEE